MEITKPIKKIYIEIQVKIQKNLHLLAGLFPEANFWVKILLMCSANAH